MKNSFTRTVNVKTNSDLELKLPNGEKITLQFRDEGTFPSLDICFEKERLVRNWARDMEPAPRAGRSPEDFKVFQLWIGLDPNSPKY